MWYEDVLETPREILDTRWDLQASVGSAIKRSARGVKAGLGHSVVLGMELERDGVSRRGALNEKHISTKVDIQY